MAQEPTSEQRWSREQQHQIRVMGRLIVQCVLGIVFYLLVLGTGILIGRLTA